ncbi:hypothetical protein HNQ99_003337 [Rhizorhapis suberifaciens]|uniref:Uncharacterized protein n=1 Tax=Rhizorhapis suberifaciens TaxID=13656 RepID=A0A840HZK5_9SPHN|nr:hypothetical protein [Rhizorhapis suberifaciens]
MKMTQWIPRLLGKRNVSLYFGRSLADLNAPSRLIRGYA